MKEEVLVEEQILKETSGCLEMKESGYEGELRQPITGVIGQERGLGHRHSE